MREFRSTNGAVSVAYVPHGKVEPYSKGGWEMILSADSAGKSLMGLFDVAKFSKKKEGAVPSLEWTAAVQKFEESALKQETSTGERVSVREAVLDEVLRERGYQDVQWGGAVHDDEHSDEQWSAYVSKQLFVVAAVPRRRRESLVRAAALLVAWIESMDRSES